jgi:glycosyltransferase involved in cell wall biosynthesis
MRVAIADSQVAFLHGGAESLTTRLADAVRALGHDVEVLRFPFNPARPADLGRVLDFCSGEDLGRYIAAPDVVVALRFPAYLVQHPDKRVWLLHQLRQYYEYYEETRAHANGADTESFRARLVEADTRALSGASRLYAQSRRIAARLRDATGVEAPAVLYPPLPSEVGFYSGRQERYVFAPSRLERHKRQDLLIDALAYVTADVKAVIGGEGGGYETYRRKIETLGLGDRVLLTGRLPHEVQAAWYANALAVFFGPHDEDYGFVTLEAMLSGKPVITCHDSGATLEFVDDGMNGFVTAADPREIAARIDELAARPARAAEMGAAGRERYLALGLTWERTAATLIDKGNTP